MRHVEEFVHGVPLFFPYRKIAPHVCEAVVGVSDAGVSDAGV